MVEFSATKCHQITAGLVLTNAKVTFLFIKNGLQVIEQGSE
jgi:hypothetical protein